MNTIVFVADALRADHCSFNGYNRQTTPNIDKIAEEGTNFSHCFTQATWTRASAASILTGCYPDVHKTENRQDALSKEVPYIPDLLNKSDVSTIGLSTMGNVSTSTGFDRGFDSFVDIYKNPDVIADREKTTPEKEKIPEDKDIIAYPRAEDILNRFVGLRDDLESKDDIFILIWAIDPHDPYNPPESHEHYVESISGVDSKLGRERGSLSKARTENDFEHLINLYDSEIKYLDEQFGCLISLLKSWGVYNETNIAFLGDHGESFGERDWHGKPVIAHSTPPFDERLRVPLVIKPAISVQSSMPDNDSESKVETIDLAATILEWYDIDSEDIQGQPLSSKTLGKDIVYSKTWQENSFAKFYSVRGDSWKYIRMIPPNITIRNVLDHPRHFIRHMLSAKDYLYNLNDDSAEVNNIASNQQQKVREFEKLLEKHIDYNTKFGEHIKRKQFERDDETESQLEALGYLS